MDKKSGHPYVLNEKGYKQIEEKGLLYPSESMVIAGALDENRGNPFVIKLVDSQRHLRQSLQGYL